MKESLLITLAAYLLGLIPFGYLSVRWKKRIDVRSTGSRAAAPQGRSMKEAERV